MHENNKTIHVNLENFVLKYFHSQWQLRNLTINVKLINVVRGFLQKLNQRYLRKFHNNGTTKCI